ncbi:hypothetical protein Q783_06925 [Carnobacterium inhibens subsp. gilichinskyi]|uniref:Uncharacterized protein n=1 Tax=Carnobacterium inhibens subsp. gilichinskyi TaxID=1266845 RepID=U5SG20_9LACT|nr:hypothetical protein Q783_06925 [Carnobacterium inhibens subsp. gilichinskyi]
MSTQSHKERLKAVNLFIKHEHTLATTLQERGYLSKSII